MIRYTGELLLGLGFALIVTAALLRAPTALDANIGAGFLALIGLPVGALGGLRTVAGVTQERGRRQD